VFADEYQDVNFAQYSWLRLICAGHSQLFAVGDDDQSIYSWRGSDLSLMRRFTQDFPSSQHLPPGRELSVHGAHFGRGECRHHV
jgi:DNA helicase-2/ATP-dependent DNA helicase PcrA